MANHVWGAELSAPRTGGFLLRRMLVVDGVSSGAVGLLFLVAAGWLSPYLGLSELFLRTVGFAMLPWLVLLLVVAGRPRPSDGAIRSIIVANLLWVVASVLLLLSGFVSPTMLGTAIVILQAAVVAGFAGLQYFGWTRPG